MESNKRNRPGKKENIMFILHMSLFICLGFIIILVVIRFILPAFVFFPSARLEATPAVLNIPFEDVTLTASDNTKLHAWYIPAPNSRANLLFFHGNGGNISYCLDSVKIFHELGLSVFILSYRGYGQSEGRPSIRGINLDALAAWHWLVDEKKIPASNIIVFGFSLGGAVAMELQRSVTPGALILESTFSSLADMSPFPASVAPFFLGGDYWNSIKTARGLTVPTLVIHSPQDSVVPYQQGKRLYEAVGANESITEKTFLEIQGDHNSGFLQSLEVYAAGLELFLTKHLFASFDN
jgi:fermentation-respiration switch protein FrsA (DUF1100 family)